MHWRDRDRPRLARKWELTGTTSTVREVPPRRGRTATALRQLGRDRYHDRCYDAVPWRSRYR